MDRVPFPIARYDQIASVVPDLESAMQEHWERFGIGPWTVYTYGPPLVKDMTYQGRRSDYRMRLAFCFSDNIQLVTISSRTPKIDLAASCGCTVRRNDPSC